ncbi:MAG: hypothetical protein U0359_10655 [Byssovorax sp.]
MHTLAKLGAALSGALLLASASGCVIVADGPFPGDFADSYAALTWSTRDTWDNRTINCHTAGADTVRTIASNLDTGEVFVDLFDCQDEEGITAEISTGDYAFDAELVRCSDWSCNRAAVLDSVPVWDHLPIYGGGVYDLGHVVFMVDLR